MSSGASLLAPSRDSNISGMNDVTVCYLVQWWTDPGSAIVKTRPPNLTVRVPYRWYVAAGRPVMHMEWVTWLANSARIPVVRAIYAFYYFIYVPGTCLSAS